jgi:hypothetical protein
MLVHVYGVPPAEDVMLPDRPAEYIQYFLMSFFYLTDYVPVAVVHLACESSIDGNLFSKGCMRNHETLR